jgi:hypothetical protein
VNQTLLLFDVDGVLLHPVGYKVALRDMVNWFAAQMGQPEWGPDEDEIAVFEACGITNEWDSGAMCVSAILLAALTQQPDLRRETIDETISAIKQAGLALSRPALADLARELHIDGHTPAYAHLSLLTQRVDAAYAPLLSALLNDVHSLTTPTTRHFQTLTLGSDGFKATYGQAAPFESASYLETYDISLLDESHRERLLQWRQETGHGAAIFTARPSLPPRDLPVPQGYPPEGDLAARLLRLDGEIPLIGQGRMQWIAAQYGRKAVEYVKPAPVQALAAIGAASCQSECPALEAAAALVERDQLTGPLADLAGHTTRVIVFEDATGGIRATKAAVERLQQVGLDVSFEAIGVSPNVDKRAALSTVATRVVDDVNQALDTVL